MSRFENEGPTGEGALWFFLILVGIVTFFHITGGAHS